LSDNGNPAHPVSARFGGLDMYWANPIELNAPYGIEADYLFTSTADSWTMSEPFYTNPEVPYLFERDAAMTRGKKILGASLSGVFPSWFYGREKPETDDETEIPDMPLEAKPARIIVVGETDFATGFLNVTGGQANLNFLVNAADWLCNDDDIIGIRSRESSSGRLDRITDNDERAKAMKSARVINVFVVPIFVIIAGVFFALRRNLKAKSFRDEKTENDKEL
jgi:hypothetical protein